MSVKAKKWIEEARKAFDAEEKLSMSDAKSLLDSGEKLKVNSQEIRTLRASLRAARGWINRVKKCNFEQGSVDVCTIKDLIEEHNSFY